ncbi:MAG: hypothetical protein Q8R92_01415 [Deltaproteobacteria bacterium]|nr:hypothetical protein [Deltaproteobacteria bacterium]
MAEAVQIDETDKAILGYVANEEPWHVVCGVFCQHFDEPAEFVATLFRLRELGLIEITAVAGSPEPTLNRLLADGKANHWHEQTEWRDGAIWTLRATDQGFACASEGTAGGNA